MARLLIPTNKASPFMSRYSSLALVLAMLLMAGCTYFRLPVLQGNIVDYDKAEKLELGMTPRQVEFLLGTPLIRDSFGSPRWDYVVYYRNPDAKVMQKNLSIYFENEVVARIEGRDELLADWRKKKAILKKAKEPLEKPHPGQFPANANESANTDPAMPTSSQADANVESKYPQPADSAPASTASSQAGASESTTYEDPSGWIESPHSDNSRPERNSRHTSAQRQAPSNAEKPASSPAPKATEPESGEDTSGWAGSPGSESKDTTKPGPDESSAEQANDYPPDMTNIYR